eukprot:CAMPEP_0170242444 /NCGR_PEP_ID=MMETSP0116_2-20130129/20993_1 /TAXON_ID=400756 /ORGANISM="Durinskia baltica, Strain CSIRO CS-38" /LENGTH=74 /DNA_ID=CAMNT_0010493289 /DNA_START=512 /DNA_END=733 /DNA_ORIENTATION=+
MAAAGAHGESRSGDDGMLRDRPSPPEANVPAMATNAACGRVGDASAPTRVRETAGGGRTPHFGGATVRCGLKPG